LQGELAAVRGDSVTIDKTMSGRILNWLQLYDRLGYRRADAIWRRASLRFAQKARGVVTVFTGDRTLVGTVLEQRPTVFFDVELRALIDNRDVTAIRSLTEML